MRFGIVILILTIILFSGCVQLPASNISDIGKAGEVIGNISEKIDVQQCTPSYSATLPKEGKIGKNAVASVVATCAKGKKIELFLNEEKIGEEVVNSNDESTVTFSVPFKTEGANTIKISSNGELIKSGEASVSPLGSNDTSGVKNDAFSAKDLIASGFEIENEIGVKSVGVFLKKLYSTNFKSSRVVVEIRPNDNDAPAESIIATAAVPFDKLTMNERWIWFNFNESVNLKKGRYWLVFRVEQEKAEIINDVANIHYVGEDTEKKAGWYSKKMTLEWDKKEGDYKETEWQPANYDRIYSVLISSETH